MGIWPCNELAVQVFLACDIEALVGMSIFWTGISPQAIAAVCHLLRVPPRDRADVLEDVRFMGKVVAGSRNKRQDKTSKHDK